MTPVSNVEVLAYPSDILHSLTMFYAGFLKTRDKTSHAFFKLFLKTQMFITFIEERSFVTENDDKFAFFDDCTDKVWYSNLYSL